ncbi:uncharacterized protein LOC134980217 [Pseudophryne corroboree]|uniref:uncharacterized protein LOC134980217 n=1 Tax=Pseudophryne corroboree TaxID=495146 RepID=UPI003081CE63
MNSLYCWFIILLFCLQSRMLSNVSNEEIIHVSATVGGNVTLPVRGLQGFTDIDWMRVGGNNFATTTPDGNVDIREDDYIGRLYGSNDGSLTITNLTAGLYTANIQLSDGKYIYRTYNVSISGKLPDNEIVTHDETSATDPCSVSCRIDGANMTLTCGINSTHDIDGLYDPNICTCITPNANCSRCILEKSCSTGGNTDSTSSLALICSPVAVVVVVLLVISVLYCIRYRVKRYEKHDPCLGTLSTLLSQRSVDQEKPLEADPLQNESSHTVKKLPSKMTTASWLHRLAKTHRTSITT